MLSGDRLVHLEVQNNLNSWWCWCIAAQASVLTCRCVLLASRHKTHHVFNFIPKDVHRSSSSLVPDIATCHPEHWTGAIHGWSLEEPSSPLLSIHCLYYCLAPCIRAYIRKNGPQRPNNTRGAKLLLPPVIGLLPLPYSSFVVSSASIAASWLRATNELLRKIFLQCQMREQICGLSICGKVNWSDAWMYLEEDDLRMNPSLPFASDKHRINRLIGISIPKKHDHTQKYTDSNDGLLYETKF